MTFIFPSKHFAYRNNISTFAAQNKQTINMAIQLRKKGGIGILQKISFFSKKVVALMSHF